MYKKIFAIFVVLFVSFSCCSNSFVLSDSRLEEKRFIQKLHKSVAMISFTIKSGDANYSTIRGTAFSVGKKHLITAGHLCLNVFKKFSAPDFLDSSSELYFINENFQISNTTDSLKIISIDTVNDICLIESKNNPLIPLKVELDEYELGEEMYVVGAPTGTFPIFTKGYVAMNEPVFDGRELSTKVMLSIPIFQGNSGSPLFNKKGNVVGMIVAANPKYPYISFATNSLDLINFIKDSLNK